MSDYGLPPHLRDGAPYAVCDRCGRKTWATDEFGAEDRMTQPDGNPCGGRFVQPDSTTEQPLVTSGDDDG